MKRNPFRSELSLRFSNYCLSVQRQLKYAPKRADLAHLTLEVFHELQDRIVDAEYPCLGAQAAFRQEAYRFGVYPAMGTNAATAGLAHDLFTFLEEHARIDSGFSTFLAVFSGPARVSELAFESLLWHQLERLHTFDRAHHRWSPAVSADPEHPRFAYSFAETPVFVIGMHSNSSREARRFPYPMLVFNPHEQFNRLRSEKTFEPMRGGGHPCECRTGLLIRRGPGVRIA